jgi:hypothetical protein
MADDPLAPSASYGDSLLRPPVGQFGLYPYSGLLAGLSPEQMQTYP